MATVGRGAEQYTVRMPDGLRDRIKKAADANNRSMNAEIVAVLENAFPPPLMDIEKAIIAMQDDRAPREFDMDGARYRAKFDDNGIIQITKLTLPESDRGYGGDGTGDGFGDGDGAYGDSDGTGDGMGGSS